MSYINPRVLDRGLEVLVRESHRLALTISEPADWLTADEATVATTWAPQMAISLFGSVPESIAVVGPANAVAGRKVTVGPVTNGNVVREGIASHWALLDDTNKRLLATAPLAATIELTEVNPVFTLTQFDIIMPGV